jgi:hypothetical protein
VGLSHLNIWPRILKVTLPNVFQMDDVRVGVPMAGLGTPWLEPGLRVAAWKKDRALFQTLADQGLTFMR